MREKMHVNGKLRGFILGAALGVSLLAVGLFAAPDVLAAGQATTQVKVSAQILGSCTISATPINFGVYDPASSVAVNANGTVTTQCGTTTTITGVSADPGQFPYSAAPVAAQFTTQPTSTGGAAVTRGMSDGTAYLLYDLFTDPGYTTIWNTTNTELAGVVTQSTVPITFTVYGQVPSNEKTDLAAGKSFTNGTYNDTVTVTVAW